MAWYTGKDKIVAICVGDSNLGAIATPTNTAPNLQTFNPNNRFYARDGSLPYVQSGHTWQPLNHDSTSRLDERESANGDGTSQGILYAGQVLGGHGCPVLQMADTVQRGTSLPVYAYGGFMGGATSTDLIGYLWSQLVSSINTALAAIPGSPAAADVIYLSVGGADLVYGTAFFKALFPDDWHQPFTSPTDEQFYANIVEFRRRCIEQGWWVPGTTQIVLTDIPRNGYAPVAAYPAWQGLALMLARLNDRIALIDSVGRTYDPPFPIHYSPQSYTDMGREAGEKIVAQIPKQQSITSVGGVRLSIGGQRLMTQGAA